MADRWLWVGRPGMTEDEYLKAYWNTWMPWVWLICVTISAILMY